MAYYPIFLRLDGRPCVVIGGGGIAERKVEGLLRAGGQVRVVSPDLTARLFEMVASGEITHLPRRYHRGDLHGAFLAFAATDEEEVNAAVAREAEDEGVLLNVVDRASQCSFIAPAVVEQGDLAIAISTGGASPVLARRVREQLEREFGPEYAEALRLLGGLRRRLAAEGRDNIERHRIFLALVDSPLLTHLRAGNREAVDRLLRDTVGGDYTLDTIGLPS